MFKKFSGEWWIRTTEEINQQIYSLPHLATLVIPQFSPLWDSKWVVNSVFYYLKNLRGIPLENSHTYLGGGVLPPLIPRTGIPLSSLSESIVKWVLD